jgi:branched-chain amino acid transport system substrate-binding protein
MIYNITYQTSPLQPAPPGIINHWVNGFFREEIAMKPKFVPLFAFFIIASLVIAACSAPATTQPQVTSAPGSQSTTLPATGNEKTIVIGFTTSQTGSLNVESTRQTHGLQLWMKTVNDAGGIKLKDGSAVKVDLKFYDDQSATNKIQELYTRLIDQDKADFLISPYSSGLADAAAVIAQQNNKIMITTGAASDSTYQKGYTLVYQAYTPASKYLTGALDMLKKQDPSAKKIAIVHENDKFSSDVAKALNDYAQSQGYNVVINEGYDTGTADFAPFINKIQSAAPDAIMGGGHFQDGSTFAKQLFEKNLPVKMEVLLVAPPEPTFAQIGEAAVGVIGPSQWEPQVVYNASAAQKANLPFYGPSSDEFTKAYKAAYNEDPSYHSAGGYAAGLILQNAIETAGSLDPNAVKTALDNMNLMTFFGHIQFDTSAAKHGLQVGHEMVYIQWQKDASGNLVKQVVWPEAGASAKVLYPLH